VWPKLGGQVTKAKPNQAFFAPSQRYTCTRFYSSFFTFFWHHSIIDKAEAHNFKNFVKLRVKSSYIIGFSRIPRYRRKRTVSLRVFGENDKFHSTYSLKTKNSASSLNTIYIAESTQFYSAFSPTTISLTPRFCRKREVWLTFSLKPLKTIRKRTDTKTALSLTSRFRRQRSAMLHAFGENVELLKILNICANFKNFFKNVGRTAFCTY
jgi:hypothetical protein